MNDLTFNSEAHEYQYKGIKVPSVTTILKEMGFVNFDGIPPHILEKKRIFGTRIHELTEIYDKEGYYECEDEKEEEYLDCWVSWLADQEDCEILEIETRVFCKKFWYAGTIDRIIDMGDFYVVLDIKTGAFRSSYKLQVSAYGHCMKDKYKDKPIKRLALELNPKYDNGYKEHWLEDVSKIFLGLAIGYNWMMANK